MAKRTRKRKSRGPDYKRFTLMVGAASARVERDGPGVYKLEPDGKSGSSITIEGILDRPAIRDVLKTKVLVFEREVCAGNPGAAIGGGTNWQVVADLPPPQFAHLLAIALAGKLLSVDLLFQDLKRGRGTLRSVSFNTAPVPDDAEDEE